MSLLARSIPMMGLLVGLASAAFANPYTFTIIGGPLGCSPGGCNVGAGGINNAGQIVGNFSAGGIVDEAFLYSGGTYTILEDPLGIYTYIAGINNAGEIVGTYHRDQDRLAVLFDNRRPESWGWMDQRS
jgi:probable HAF family extracellular repeat protein